MEHLRHLRQSDPLIHLRAWHDLSELHEAVRRSPQALIHQQALVNRALNAHALSAGALVRKEHEADHEAVHVASIKRAVQRRLHTVDSGGERFGERTSNDSVIAFLDAPETGYLQPLKYQKTHGKDICTVDVLADEVSCVKTLPQLEDGGVALLPGESSPTSVFGTPMDLAKDFPPLPAAHADHSKQGKAVDHALHQYKVVSGPGWYSDS